MLFHCVEQIVQRYTIMIKIRSLPGMRNLFFAAISILAIASCAPQMPQTRKDATVDDYFGTAVPDPYRWLEDDLSPETAAWVEAQNKYTNPTLIRIDTKAGHGGGKPMAKVLEEQADIYSFIMTGTGMKL